MKLQIAKGMKDYLPEEMILLNEIIDKLRNSFESAGFNPLSTPIIERFDLLSAKYAGGAEILKETFKLSDQGGRELGLRYDLTVPFARIVGQNPQFKFPFKRYQMEKVYRDGPIGLGRYREFWQCDLDVVGSKSMKAEAELLAIVEEFFNSVGLKFKILVNNRKVLNSILDSFEIEDKNSVIAVIDKFDKMSKKDLIIELTEMGISNASEIIEIFDDFSADNESKLKACSQYEGIEEVRELLSITALYGLENVEFTPILARGLSYYTGSVFEVVLIDNKVKGTVCAGGRYDNMIGDLLSSKQKYPAVGISFGLSRIFDALDIETKKTVTKVMVISIKQDETAVKIVKDLRKLGIKSELDIVGRGFSKNLAYANSLGIPFVFVIGENEVNNKKITLRDMTSGDQKEVSFSEAVKIVK